MLERPTKETHLGVSTASAAPAVFGSASQVESWRRTVVVVGPDPSHGGPHNLGAPLQPSTPAGPPTPPVVLSSSPVAEPASTAPEPTLLAVPPPPLPAVDRPSSATSAARPGPSGGGSPSASAGGGPYPASDPLGLFIKRPVPSLAPRPSPAAALERTLSLSSSTGSTSAARSAPTRTPSLSEASSYADGFHPAAGPGAAGGRGPTPSASSDVCPPSPGPSALDPQPALASHSLSAGPSPASSPPTALRPLSPTDDGSPSPPLPPVSLLSALLASHSHHTKALSPHPLSSSASASASAFSSVHHPSAGPSPASSMPNSTASSPMAGAPGAGIHPHLAQSARQRRFSSGACELLGDVGEEEAEVDEAEGGSAPRGKQQVLGEPRLAPALLRPVFVADQPQQQALRLPPPPKARIGIPSAKPPSIFLAASPAPSTISHAPSAAATAASAASSVRKSSIVFIDDPEIAARRAPELSTHSTTAATTTTTPATSDAATTDSSSHAQPSTPELSPAPAVRASLAAYALPSSSATALPPVRRGLSFAEPIKPPPSPTFVSSSSHAQTELGSQQQHPPPPTPVKKASGLTFAVAAVCARPKALGPAKPVGVIDEDDAGSDDDDDDDDDDAGSDEDEGEEEGDEEEDDLDSDGDLDAAEADGYEEDDEGEGGSDLDVGERGEGARYRFRRDSEALFGADSDDDGVDSLASSDNGDGSDSEAFDETASIRTKTSGRGSIFSNFSGLAPFDGSAGAVGDDDQAGGSGTYVQPTTLHHRRSSSLRNRAGYARHSPTLPPIHAAVGGDPSSPLALSGAGPTAGPSTSSTAAPAPAPPRRRPLFSFIRGRRGAAPRSPHHAPRLLSNGATGFSPGLAQPLAGDGGGPTVDRSICRDDFLPSHMKSEEGKQKERAAERRAELQLSGTDGGGAGSGTGVGRNGQCSRHRSPPPSSSGRERSHSQDRSASGKRRGGGGRSKADDERRGRGRSQKEPIPPTFDALDRAFPPFRPAGAAADAVNDDDNQAADTLRPPSAFALHHPSQHVSDAGARPGPSLGPRVKNRRRSYNHGLACRAKATGGQASTPPVFLSEAETDLRSRPIPTPCRRLVDDNWTGDDGGF